MIKINWNKFKIKNENHTKAFEDLSYFLFCRKFKQLAGIFRYKNQVGIETEPVEYEKKLIGFQAKWFESKINKKKILDAITKAKEKNLRLGKIVFYLNQEFSESTKKGSKDGKLKSEIESCAKKKVVELEWIVPSNLEMLLNQPSNLDLAQLYFDSNDEFGFITSCSDPRMLTFLQSLEYIELPFINSKTKNFEDITNKILAKEQKNFLILGHPGSGKSVSMHKFFQKFAGLDKKRVECMKNVWLKNKAIPMLINLKNCTFETIENIICNRKDAYNVRKSELGFIYLLDGLDELSSAKADHVLSYLYELGKDDRTKKIIISCRSGNINKVKAKLYFENIIECKIDNLTQDHIDDYFANKNVKLKNDQLKKLRSENPKLLVETKDILLVKLLWDTIDNLNERSTIIDLLDKKVRLIINAPKYRKNIEELNLLDPKENEIIELNKEISYQLQKKFQFRLSQKEIQNIILEKYPRIDYKDANVILNYIVASFFDGSSSQSYDQPDNTTFAYQHRRYQDFFFIKRLAELYEENPNVLRGLNILSNRDFFENIFLPYARKQHLKDRNLPGIIELNLIEVYLGNHNGFGADDPYYQNSPEFTLSLARQDEIVFQELIADESLNVKNKIAPDLSEVKNKFELWAKDKENWQLTEYLKDVWSNDISFLLENIVIFWKFNKLDIANELNKILSELIKLFKHYKFHDNLKKNDLIDDPFWIKWEDYLYLLIVIKKKNPSDILTQLIRGKYESFDSKDKYKWHDERGKEKLMKSFLRVCINNQQEDLSLIIEDLDGEELLMLLNVLVSVENLPLLIKNVSISQKIKAKIQTVNTQNIWLLFCKQIFNVKITEEERKFLEDSLSSLLKKWSADFPLYKAHTDYAIVSYTLGRNLFEVYLDQQKEYPFQLYNVLEFYAVLFIFYVELLKGEKNIEAIVRDYIQFNKLYSKKPRNGKYLKADMSFLWAHIFVNSGERLQKLVNVKSRLIKEENIIVSFEFCLRLQKLDQELFLNLVNRSELEIFEDKLKNWDYDFHSYVSRCFILALFFARINKQKSISYIAKGINEGMLRHGWRKDNIVSYFLVDALKILWRNNWASKKNLKKYTEMVFELTIRVGNITDDKGMWYGSCNVIALMAAYDIDLAIDLKNKLMKKNGSRNLLNSTISSILNEKVNLGLPIEEIEKGMKEYKKYYRYDGKPASDYYEQKFKIYMAIAESDFYTKGEQEKAFCNAYLQVEEMKQHELDCFLSDFNFKDTKKSYVGLCEKYGKEINVTFDKKDEFCPMEKEKISETAFIKKCKEVKGEQELIDLYKELNNHKNNIVLTKKESWGLLVEKTYSINKDIKQFIDLLAKNYFPHSDEYTYNSKYFHYGLASALRNINTKKEIMNYLFSETTGYCGFVNVMKSYEVIGDREMCVKLFLRYLRFCDFLVN